MKHFIFSILLLFCYELQAQDEDKGMDNDHLDFIINTLTEEIEGKDGNWRFIIDSTLFICLTDEYHNRMRIISPIDEAKNVTDEQMLACMEANFHTALDSKYAISDGYMWAVFIHPLKELTEQQVIDGISQVYSSAKTYGTTYTSGWLTFPDREEKEERLKKYEEEERKKKLKRS